ncbi:DUF6602 domain-containing protein [Paenibacillus crassostreae]|uniref:DUF6602 domain-containing protein n=1 Tax=Paenibacillus crassostreae TaxID=1763538 RepID=A0A162KR22_9BACL|nr:DUF6602 domain-containing protein [Paenibacillus crassostreae]AOZ92574.1 hypothetical protein LPB68_10220 [Paenibacillus crassostreae]OAB72523.1 hypothetical protein PNBC_16665 [Paenibacillus crassostreae]
MINIDIGRYHSSISKEFSVIKDRVRLLIGNSHWGEEGRYKEVILMNYLKKHLPSNLSVGTGFIMKYGDNESISTQIDLIIYENNCPIIFNEGDFVIVHPRNVVGVIEVKSKFRSNLFKDVLVKAEAINGLVNRQIFNGIFYYDYEGNIDFSEGSNLENVIKEESRGLVNHIAIGESLFIKHWPEGNPEINNQRPSTSVYRINDLSFSYFLSNLIEITHKLSRSETGELTDIEWFLYPVEGTKEARRINNIVIE